MSVVAPPPHDELEALIREARARQRRRRVLGAATLALAAAAGLSTWAALPGGPVARNGGGARGPSAGASIGQKRIEAAGRWVPIVAIGSSGGVTWAANGAGFWLSADDGRSWRGSLPRHIAVSGDPVARVIQVDFIDRRHGWISADDAYGGFPIPRPIATFRHMEIDRTTDAGRTWHASMPPGCFERCSDASLTFFDARHGYAFVELQPRGGELFATRDGGATWSPVGRTRWHGSIAFLDRRHAVGRNGIVVRVTSDGGRRWRSSRLIPRPTFSSVRAFGRQLVVFGLSGTPRHFRLVAYTSRDGGGHWHARVAPAWLEPGPPGNDVQAPTASDWVVPSPTKLFVTHDAGRAWHVVRQPDLPPGWSIWQIDFTSARVGWAIFARGGQHLFKAVVVRTTDGGVHWSPAGPRRPQPHRHG